jgi:glycerate 2-kinase
MWGRSLPAVQREIVAALIQAALQAVDPQAAVRRVVRRDGNFLTIGDVRVDLGQSGKVLVVGAGKAGAPMALALNAILGDRIDSGWINVKQGHVLEDQDAPNRIGRIHIQEAGHPLPDAAGQEGARQILELVAGLTSDDLVICLVSGGGSALTPAPAQGITLAEKQQVTDVLLACGATINELNTVRKHLSEFKGGQLARAASPARVVSLILSDVVGNPLDVIASGPTVPDSSTWIDSWEIMARHAIIDQMPDSVRRRLEQGRDGELPDTPKTGDPVFERTANVIIGDNRIAALASVSKAKELGLNAMLLSTYMEGEAREVAGVLAGLAKEIARYGQPLERPACLVLGGETTVTLRGAGIGGRNQELALSAALSLAGWDGALLATLATDGTDGPTDAAGALAMSDTVARARQIGLDPAAYLADNDSYRFFDQLGDLLRLGPTNTNVNDLAYVLVF